MKADWTPLDRELNLWRDQGLTLPLWWRDDDAVEPTAQLERLSALSDDLSLPVHLAVIPAHAQPALADLLRSKPQLIPVVHGWAHRNHAPADEKKSEFRMHRPLEEVLQDARAGLEHLSTLFGDNLRPMFVPPWNRIAPEAAERLGALGYRILSTATPRKAPEAAPGLEQINTHLDPIDWRSTRGLVSPETLISRLVVLLQDRREGRADASEPFGLLTHHLVHDEDIWTFTAELVGRLRAGPVEIWTAPTANQEDLT